MATQKYMTTSTSSWPMRTKTTVTRCIPTCATCGTEHTCTQFSVPCLVTRVTPTLAQVVLESFAFIHMPSMCRRPWFFSTFFSTRTSSSFSFPSSPCTPTTLTHDWQPARLRQGEPRHLRRHFPTHRQKTRSIQVSSWPLFDSPLLLHERLTTRSPIWEERRGSRISHCESAPEEMQEERILEHSRSVHPWCTIPKDHDRIGSHWRSNPRDGQIGERGPHTHHATEEENSMYTVENGGYVRILLVRTWCPWASSWFQRSVVYFASPQEWRGSSLLPKLVAKLFLVLVELARFLVASPHLRHHRDDGPSTDGSRKIAKTVIGPNFRGTSQNLFGAKVTVTNSVTANAVYWHRRRCKEYTS